MRDAPTPSVRRRYNLGPVRLVAVVAVVAGSLMACGASGGGSDAGPTTTATPPPSDAALTTTTGGSGGTDAADGDCPSTTAMAEVVGGAVRRSSTAGGVGNTDGLSYAVSGCDYDRQDGGGSVAVDRITLQDPPAGAPFDLFRAEAQTAFAEEGFEPLPGLGDDAYRNGTEVAVLQGSNLFFLEVGGTALADVEAATATTQALAPAVLALDLTADQEALCPQFEAEVAKVLGPVDQTLNVQGSKGVGDVKIETMGCQTNLDDGVQVGVEIADGATWDDWVRAKQASDLTTHFTEATISEQSAFDTGDDLVIDDGDVPLRVTTDGFDLDAEAAAEMRLSVAQLVVG